MTAVVQPHCDRLPAHILLLPHSQHTIARSRHCRRRSNPSPVLYSGRSVSEYMDLDGLLRRRPKKKRASPRNNGNRYFLNPETNPHRNDICLKFKLMNLLFLFVRLRNECKTFKQTQWFVSFILLIYTSIYTKILVILGYSCINHILCISL